MSQVCPAPSLNDLTATTQPIHHTWSHNPDWTSSGLSELVASSSLSSLLVWIGIACVELGENEVFVGSGFFREGDDHWTNKRIVAVFWNDHNQIWLINEVILWTIIKGGALQVVYRQAEWWRRLSPPSYLDLPVCWTHSTHISVTGLFYWNRLI